MRILALTEENKKNILENLLKRSPNQYEAQTKAVAEILDAVKTKKDEALFAYTKQFDKAELTAETIRVTEEEISKAYEKLPAEVLEVIRKAAVNIRVYHEKQKQYSWFDSDPSGVILGQKVTPIGAVGVYVPGSQG